MNTIWFAEYFNLDTSKTKEIALLIKKVYEWGKITEEDLKSVQLKK